MIVRVVDRYLLKPSLHMASRVFVTSGYDNPIVVSCQPDLNSAINWIRDNRYSPYNELSIYVCDKPPLRCHCVDSKVFIS